MLAPLLVLLIGQAGCVSSQPTKTADAGLKVDVLQLDDGGFRVELRRDEPLREWLFLRTPAIDMRERWRWLSDGAVLEKRGKRDVVVLPKARRVLRFEVPPDDRFVQADYSLTQTFANDAGVVLYVGHFAAAEESACPETVNASPPCTAQGAVRLLADAAARRACLAQCHVVGAIGAMARYGQRRHHGLLR